MKRFAPGCLAIGLALGLLTGCDQTDPYLRPGMWHPEGANPRNIAAEVQDPRDLIRGQGEAGPQWRTGAAAVNNLWDDKPKPLLSDTTTPPAAGGSSPPAGGQ
jgi:hypothetical protein